MTTKEALHQLIDELPEEALPAIEQDLLTFRDDPVLRAARLAPEDDEELTPEAKMTDAWDRHARGAGRSVSNAELARRIDKAAFDSTGNCRENGESLLRTRP